MRFLLSAVFWLVTVAAFTPRETATEHASFPDYADRLAVLPAELSADELCARYPEGCAAAAEAAQLAGEVAQFTARSALEAVASLEARP
jgi:hypothetical protein